MGAVNTTYTFTATDTITSTKMNNIIDETVMTADALLDGSGGSGGLSIADGKLTISANAINSSRLAANSVTSTNIVDGTILNADINASAAIAGTKITPSFGAQNITTAGGDLSLSNTGTCYVGTSSGTVQGLFYSSSTNSTVAVGSSSNNPLLFFTNNDEQMRITATGIVGIGTTAPESGLHISGLGQTTSNIIDNGNEYAFLRVSDSSTDAGSGGAVLFSTKQSDDNGAVGMAAIKGFLRDGGNNTIGDLTFSTRDAKTDTALTERMRIMYSGNVGIGTTNPTTKLDVNGTVTATAFAGNATTATTLATARTIALSGDVTGTATSFNGSANISIPVTVDNAVITAPKLSGAQTGTAPVYGIRAFASFNGTAASPISTIVEGNIGTITRTATGVYSVTFTTSMPSANYTIMANARYLDGNTYEANCWFTSVTASSFVLNVAGGGGNYNSDRIDLMILA